MEETQDQKERRLASDKMQLNELVDNIDNNTNDNLLKHIKNARNYETQQIIIKIHRESKKHFETIRKLIEEY